MSSSAHQACLHGRLADTICTFSVLFVCGDKARYGEGAISDEPVE